MKLQGSNFKKYHRALQLVYFALLQGVLFFMFLIYFQTDDSFYDLNLSDSKILTGIIVVLAALFLSFYLYAYLLKNISAVKGIENKLEKYTSAFIVKMAILEGGSFFNLVMYMISGNKAFLIFAAVLLLAMMMSFPGIDKIENALDLSMGERTYIDNPEKDFD